MSVTTLMNRLPKSLRFELKTNWLFDGAFTTPAKTTVKPEHWTSVTAGLDGMMTARQELLLIGGITPTQTLDEVVRLLREVEVLRYVLGLMNEEAEADNRPAR